MPAFKPTGEEKLARFIAIWACFAIFVGQVWLWAWIFNPSISTGTVWFVAFVLGILERSIVGMGLSMWQRFERLR